jgi:hypothetical protein
MFTQAGWADRQGGAPGLNGGSYNGATASFANVTVTIPTPAPMVQTATAYTGQRSPDGSAWAQVASGGQGAGSNPFSATANAALGGMLRLQAGRVGGDQPEQLPLPAQEVGGAVGLFTAALGDRASLGGPEPANQGKGPLSELVIGQGQAALGVGMVGEDMWEAGLDVPVADMARTGGRVMPWIVTRVR